MSIFILLKMLPPTCPCFNSQSIGPWPSPSWLSSLRGSLSFFKFSFASSMLLLRQDREMKCNRIGFTPQAAIAFADASAILTVSGGPFLAGLSYLLVALAEQKRGSGKGFESSLAKGWWQASKPAHSAVSTKLGNRASNRGGILTPSTTYRGSLAKTLAGRVVALLLQALAVVASMFCS